MNYQERLRELSDALITVQKPILILDAIKWPQQVRNEFLQNGQNKLPAIDRAYYESLELSFDPDTKRNELKDLKAAIRRRLGKNDPLGRILQATVDQYLQVVDLLSLRGQPDFLRVSRELYGSASDHMRGDRKSLIDMGERLCHIFSLPAAQHMTESSPKNLDAETAVGRLKARLDPYFATADFSIELNDGIVSDASAGGDRIKINSQSQFSELDLQVLEVHEGWVHIGTTLNGRRQPWASWLSVGSPRITAHQEGLAVLIETLTFSSFPGRAKRISDRVLAINMAENGADFIEVFRFFTERGLDENESYTLAQRTFRGGQVAGGSCFTKDLSYVKGFVETVNFIKSAILADVPEILPLLFVGKVALDDIPVLYEYQQQGLIAAPHYLPPMFRDLNGLYVWFGFSSGLSLVDLGSIQRHFQKLFDGVRHAHR